MKGQKHLSCLSCKKYISVNQMVNTAKFYFVDCQPINIKEIIELEYHTFIAPNETRELGRDHKQPRAIF